MSIHTHSRNLAFSYGTKSGAMFFDMNRYTASESLVGTTATPKETVPNDSSAGNKKYIPWGASNDLPKKMIEDIESCGILSGGIDGKARFGLGKGIMPATLVSRNPDGSEVLEAIMDSEIDDWLEENVFFDSSMAWIKDSVGLGQDLCRYKFNRAGDKIGICAHHPVAEMRYAPKNAKGILDTVHLSANWCTGNGVAAEDLITLPLLPKYAPGQALEALQSTQRRNKEFAMVVRQHSWNRHFYSMPLWYSAKLWVEISKGVPEMKTAMFENNIRIKYMVIIHEQYWTRTYPEWYNYTTENQDKLRKALWDEIDNFLAGSENAYKSIFVDGHTDINLKERWADIEIKPIEDTTKPGELLPDSAAANSEILFALMMNPALMGATSPGGGKGGYGGGAGSGSDIREAALVQVMIQEFERQSIARKLALPSRINGWKKRYPNLVWRFPGLVLTTLDKGGSTESVVNGGNLQNK